MKASKLKQRLRKPRPMATISIRMPEDVVDDLKRVAPLLGFTGYQPLMRAYIGQALRRDLERLEAQPALDHLITSLRKRGVSAKVIASALAEAEKS
jgi:hypothetical protein